MASETAATASVILVGEVVKGGSHRDRVAACVAETAAFVSEDTEEGFHGIDGAAAQGGQEEKGLWRRQVPIDVSEGLTFLHERGLFHGALSSDNVLLNARGRATLGVGGFGDSEPLCHGSVVR